MYGYHLVFTTKYRRKLITPTVERELYSYLRNKSNQLGLSVLAMNGLSDHVHLYVQSASILDIPKIVRTLKGGSSHFIRERFPELTTMDHFWSGSYYSAPVFTGNDKALICYIERQKYTAELDRQVLP